MRMDDAISEIMRSATLEQSEASGEQATLSLDDHDDLAGAVDEPHHLMTTQRHLQGATISTQARPGSRMLSPSVVDTFTLVPRQNSSGEGESRGSAIVYSDILDTTDDSGDAVSVWRTRPMVLHKVANPLHLHYLHWRLTHCGIPPVDLLSPPALENALSWLPTVSDIFHMNFTQFAHNAAAARSRQ